MWEKHPVDDIYTCGELSVEKVRKARVYSGYINRAESWTIAINGRTVRYPSGGKRYYATLAEAQAAAEALSPKASKACDHCGTTDRPRSPDRWDNWLCQPCAEAEALAEWEDN